MDQHFYITAHINFVFQSKYVDAPCSRCLFIYIRPINGTAKDNALWILFSNQFNSKFPFSLFPFLFPNILFHVVSKATQRKVFVAPVFVYLHK